jgi:hypothetical protein
VKKLVGFSVGFVAGLFLAGLGLAFVAVSKEVEQADLDLDFED